MFNINLFDEKAKISKKGKTFLYKDNKYIYYNEGEKKEFLHQINFPLLNNYSIDCFNIVFFKENCYYIFCEEKFLIINKENFLIEYNEKNKIKGIIEKKHPANICIKYDKTLKLLFSSLNLDFPQIIPKYFLFNNIYQTKDMITKQGFIVPDAFYRRYDFTQTITLTNSKRKILEISNNHISPQIKRFFDISLLSNKQISLYLLVLFKKKKVPKVIIKKIMSFI